MNEHNRKKGCMR